MSNDKIIKNQSTQNNEGRESNENNNNNFIDFINHLLTFNKQMELLHRQSNNNSDNNSNNNSNNNNYGKVLPFRFNINSRVIIKLCDLVLNIFKNEPNTLYLEAPLYIFGDIHGQFSDMIHFLEMTG
jgi:hypothetical protein